MTGENQTGDLFQPGVAVEGGSKVQRYARPPKLRRVVSISSAVPAEKFFALLKDAKVTALLDTRLSRAYEGARFAHENDFEYLVRVHGIEYLHATQFAPTKEMREVFDKTFKSVTSALARDKMAWTKFLKSYENLLVERKPLQDPTIRRIINGDHEAVAILCHCHHHEDCHRSYACGIMVNYIEGLELRVLYPGGKEPAKASPRRYRLEAFRHAGLSVNGPRERG